MELDLSDAQLQRLCEAAARAGMTPEQYAEQAVSAAIRAKYVLPKSGGSVTPFQAPKRDKP